MDYIKMTHNEMKDLVIKEGNNFYNGRPTSINDAVYDSLLQLIQEDEPTFNIYDYIKLEGDGVPVPHNINFRDFNKQADIANIDSEEKFNEMRKSYYVLPKFDGCSIVTKFNEDGTLLSSASRSDDVTGFLQTNKLRNKIKNCSIPANCKVMLAEAVCPKYDSNEQPLGRAKSNALINSKYCQEDVDKYITLMPFDYYLSDGTKIPNIDLEVIDYEVFKRLRDKGEYIYEVNGLLYPCDGIVNYPRDSNNEKLDIHKLYFSEMMDSTLRNITWLPAENSGVMTPVANFDTVVIDDTEVSNASLFNYQFILDHNMYIGMPLKVIKANLTIPQIHPNTWELLENSNEEAKIKCNDYVESIRCPYCGSKVRRYGEVGIVCDNDACNWWLRFISYRILMHYNDFNDATMEMVYSDNQINLDFMKSYLTSDKIDNIKFDLLTIFDIVKIPRFNNNKISSINAEYVSRVTNDHIDDYKTLILELVKKYTTDLQWEYFQLMYGRLQGLLNLIGN